jgi:FkbM family methyltransferase
MENTCVIDVGANIGEFSLNFIGVPNIEIVAFEPDDLAMKCLQLNDPDNIIMKVNLIAGNRNSKVDFFISSEHANSSTVLPNEFTGVLSKNSVRLSDYISNTIDPKKKIFIKVDAEGGEPEVLEGLLGIDPKWLSFIAVDCGPERNGQRTEEMALKLLKKLEFRIVKLVSPDILVGSNIEEFKNLNSRD